MAQFAVFVVHSVPAVGTTAHALVYRGDHADEAAAVTAAAEALALVHAMKVWAVPVSALTAYRIDVTSNRSVATE
jgi:hypothetical protein